VEVLYRALGEILSLGNALRLAPPLDQRAIYAALAELDGKRYANSAAADNDDLVSVFIAYR
jgi:hypothetical protein